MIDDRHVLSLPSQDAITEIVNGLFSVLVTLGVVPVIRCPTGDAAGPPTLSTLYAFRSNQIRFNTTQLGHQS